MYKKTIAIIGNGEIANIIIDAYNNGMLNAYNIVAVMGRTPEKTNKAALKAKCKACSSIDELLDTKPWIVVEAASVEAVKNYAFDVLNSGSHFAALSIGGFEDEVFREKLREVCRKRKTKVYLSAGCIGGLDALRTISLMGAKEAEISVSQNPEDLRGTILFSESLITDGVNKCIFDGTAQEAIRIMPTQINIGVAVALAGVGVKDTKVKMNTTPFDERDIATITIKNSNAFADITVGYNPPVNLAGWGIVATLNNIASEIMFM